MKALGGFNLRNMLLEVLLFEFEHTGGSNDALVYFWRFELMLFYIYIYIFPARCEESAGLVWQEVERTKRNRRSVCQSQWRRFT